MGDGPQEANHLAGDGGDGEGPLLAGGEEVPEACGEPLLGLGGDRANRFRQAVAALLEGEAGARLGEIGPGRLGQRPLMPIDPDDPGATYLDLATAIVARIV